jgi:hypothetical protein
MRLQGLLGGRGILVVLGRGGDELIGQAEEELRTKAKRNKAGKAR